MLPCPACRRGTAMRHGHDRAGRQRFLCEGCRRTFTADSVAAFAGYHWPPDVILLAVGWYLAHPLSATSVMVLLAERGIDLSKRTVLRWVQTFGPLLAAEVRKHRRRPGTTWYVDEVFFFRKKGEEKRNLYRAIDEQGQVLDVLFRDHRARGLKWRETGQRFFEGFEALHALRRGHIHLEHLVPGYPRSGATPHARARAVVAALQTLGAALTRAA